MIKLSVILSTFNEQENPYFKKILSLYNQFSEIEVIIVDGGSHDETVEIATDHGCRVLHSTSPSRGQRLNLGIENAKGKIILLNHPRSLIDKAGVDHLLKNFLTKTNFWGGFSHCFDRSGLGLSFTSWYSNNVRGKICETLYLDHCIFFSDSLKEFAIVPSVDIFEDTILSAQLREKAPLSVLPFSSVTSAVRFQKNGFLKQALLNQVLKIAFKMNFSHKLMNRVYEKGLGLNARYSENERKV